MTREVLAELGDGWRVERAEVDDIPAILALLMDDGIGKSREGDAADPVYRKAFDELSADPRQLLTVLTAPDGSVAGTMQLTSIPGLSRRGTTRVILEAVRVGAAHRGVGIGTKYLEWALEHSRTMGAGLVQLTTDLRRVDAQRFYVRLGFVASHVGMKLVL